MNYIQHSLNGATAHTGLPLMVQIVVSSRGKLTFRLTVHYNLVA